jgi:putative two-component system response regulator
VKLYIRLLAETLGKREKYEKFLTPENIRLIAISSPLHDIGKVGIPDEILLNPEQLTAGEYEIMKKHPVLGRDAIVCAEKLLGASETFLSCAREIAYSHHEKWDGTGYPQGLSGESIPLPARLMALADAYDTLTSRRVYKEAVSHEEAVSRIREDSGTHFDPDVVDAFLAVKEQFQAIAEKYADSTASILTQMHDSAELIRRLK